MEAALNPLSANGQFHSVEQCYEAVNAYIACCEYCLPALGKKRVTLLFDESIEQRSLFGTENFRATIANCKGIEGGKELIRKWYIYTRNRSVVLSSGDTIQIRLTADANSSVEGIVSKYLHDEVEFLISLPGDAVSSAKNLTLSSDQMERVVGNTDNIQSFRTWLPSYQPNPKHRAEAYIAASGEYVSPMPLSGIEAHELLLNSISDEGGTRWAFHERSSAYYCFRRTHNDHEVFHGFIETEENVPYNLREQLKM